MSLGYSEENSIQQELIGDDRQGEHRRLLDTVGDGSGTKSMIAIADEYRITPGEGEIYVIDEIRISGSDNATINPVGFLGAAALTTGCLLEVREKPGDSDEQVVLDLLDGVPLKTNNQLLSLGAWNLFDSGSACVVGVGMKVRQNGRPIRLTGAKGEFLVFETQDTFVGFTSFEVSVYLRQYVNL